MLIWWRVFGIENIEVTPEEICTELTRQDLQFRPTFRGDDQGWFAAQLEMEHETSIQIERFLVREERMRGELNTWCAWLETQPNSAGQQRVLDALVAATQIFTLQEESEHLDMPTVVCEDLSRWLAIKLNGIYQVDGQGFFDADGNLLAAESTDPADA
jgi:hypothetical protein